jgi:hypothetical protein
MPSTDSGKLYTLEAGSGRVEVHQEGIFILNLDPQSNGYTLAQMDDYHRLARRDFRWGPPLHLQVRALASLNESKGTLGFGFWNDPFSLSIGQSGTARRFPAGPQAVWFFYGSPPNDMVLAPPVPGNGWKAAILRSPRIPSLLLAPAAMAAFVAAQVSILRRVVMTTAQKAIQADEALLHHKLDQSHLYELIWEKHFVRFLVDGELVLHSTITPRPPLGLVIWIDNQYAIASPEGGFRFGMLPIHEAQSLEISELEINGEPLTLEDEEHA